MEPLSGCSPEGLAHEAIANATQWSFMNKVTALKTRPLLIVTSEDAYARGDQALRPDYDVLETAGWLRCTCLPITLTQISAVPYRAHFFAGWLL